MQLTKQRLNYKLTTTNQLNENLLNKNLSKKYDRHINQMMKKSTDTFSHIQTPGWSSLVKSQISQRKKMLNSGNYQQILSRINKMKGNVIDPDKQFKNVTTRPLNVNNNHNSKLKKNNVKDNQNQTQNRQNFKRNTKTYTSESQYLNDRDGIKYQDQQSTYSQQNQKSYQHPFLKRGRSYTAAHFKKAQMELQRSPKDITTTHASTKIKQRGSTLKQQQKNSKRWNHISVHEHLFLNSKHLQNKKLIAKIIDQEYQKKQILRFKPEINPKSIQLASSRFSRIKQKLDYQLTPQKEKDNNNIQQSQVTLNSRIDKLKRAEQNKQNRQVQKYKLLNKTFYYLSNQNTKLNQKLLHQKIESLPLSCIKTLQPILQKVYSGNSLQWHQFMELFNIGKGINNKQSFFVVIKRFFDKQQKQKQQLKQKQIQEQDQKINISQNQKKDRPLSQRKHIEANK